MSQTRLQELPHTPSSSLYRSEMKEPQPSSGDVALACTEFYNLRTVLKTAFSEQEVDALYHKEEKYSPTYLDQTTLSKYFPDKDKVTKILQGDTPFFDKVKKQNYGKFDLEFADKLLTLMKKKGIKKSTRFHFTDHQNAESKSENPIKLELGEYDIQFMTDQEYSDGAPFFLGEFANNCESIGKSGGDLCLFEAFSDSSRTFLIRKNGKIIGQSPIFIDDTNKTLVIASMVCTPDADTKIIRCLTEELSIKLLQLNPTIDNVTLGIGGANLISIGCKSFTRQRNGEPTKQFAALGKIRHSADVSEYEHEIKTCEEAMGLRILPGFEAIKNSDISHYMRDRTGARKDFFRVAEIVSRKQLAKKIQQASETRAAYQTAITKKAERLQNKKTSQQKQQAAKSAYAENITTFSQKLPNALRTILGKSARAPLQLNEDISKKQYSFSVSGISQEDMKVTTEKLSQLSGNAIRVVDATSSSASTITFAISLGFFSKHATANKDKHWEAFCHKVQNQLKLSGDESKQVDLTLKKMTQH